MAKLLYRLGRFCYRAKWIVIIAWLLVLVALGGGSLALGSHYNDVFTISRHQRPKKQPTYCRKNFPQEKNPVAEAGVTIAFKAPPGERLDSPKNSAAIDKVIKHIQDNLDGLDTGPAVRQSGDEKPRAAKIHY